jgi:16S rRNA (guanine527-N7)-methyltransferase
MTDVPRETSRHGRELARGAARWAGWEISDEALERLEDYAEWLRLEAIPAGGLGPREADRLWSRHIGDSLTFAAGWDDQAPPEVLDVGSGVGLPGVPLALLWPETVVTVLDRGGRRVRLLRRAIRILALQNVVVAQGDVFSVADEWSGMVFRGAVRPPEAVGLSARILDLGGRAVFGLSRRPERPDEADSLLALSEAFGLRAEVRPVPAEILDGGSWLLIMSSGE